MQDLISRQAAIEAAKDMLKYHGKDLTDELINYFSTNAMERIPAAKPEKTLLTVKCELDDEELSRAIEDVKNAELELISAQQKECEYWDNESHYCELNRPSAQPDLQPTCNQLATDCISRQAAIKAVEDTDWYHINKRGELVQGANSEEDIPLFKADDVYKAINSVPLE